ncbi:nuclear transport factor 2 family protein [Noviherbaspirillum sedimenti]|uniref:Nuclear transport factor 2 family protein n=1 Tax=Noviherbaspirillum sedimenti TaxID=2320865 RepID=A0A3A3G8Y8_9BURK|nr:nuclear transport factor 2 family protein [Noviherbaspirillum sedimenti]RJG03205.1 nuclear transport factor 2 family protein [Noviherbaspirillum sedimenti]RJG03219.1 nuclear transport factor 2 family protein [Noviherbaspirillum sedimenti]
MTTKQDELSVLQLLNRYGVAVDSKRWDVFDQVFTEDVIADYGAPVVFEGLAAFKRGAEAAWGPFDASQHSMSNTVWERRGDTGRSLTYGNWFIIRRGVEGGDLWEGRGWYYDEWVLRDAGWRIKRRCCRTMSWSGNLLVVDPTAKAGTACSKTYSLADAAREGLFSFFDI